MINTEHVNHFVTRYAAANHVGDEAIDYATAVLADAILDDPTLDTPRAIGRVAGAINAYTAGQTVTPSVRHYQRRVTDYLCGQVAALPNTDQLSPLQHSIHMAISSDDVAAVAKWLAPGYLPDGNQFAEHWQEIIDGIDWRAVELAILAAYEGVRGLLQGREREALLAQRRRRAA